MSHQPNNEINNADADETYLCIDMFPNRNDVTQEWDVAETNERGDLIEMHSFNTEQEALDFIAGYQLAGEHNLEEYDRLTRQYNRLAAQVGLIERYLNHVDATGYDDRENIIATIRKVIS